LQRGRARYENGRDETLACEACAEIYNDSRERNEQPDVTSQSMEHLRKQPSP